jgi:hypothetical protein
MTRPSLTPKSATRVGPLPILSMRNEKACSLKCRLSKSYSGHDEAILTTKAAPRILVSTSGKVFLFRGKIVVGKLSAETLQGGRQCLPNMSESDEME